MAIMLFCQEIICDVHFSFRDKEDRLMWLGRSSWVAVPPKSMKEGGRVLARMDSNRRFY